MHSFLSRVNALSAFALTLISALAVGLYLSSFMYPTTGQVKIGTSKVAV